MADVELRFTGLGEALQRKLDELDKLEVCVGWQAGEPRYRETKDGKKKEIPQYPDIAYWNQNGTYDMDGNVNIPARPFFMDAFMQNKAELSEFALNEVSAALLGQKELSAALYAIGAECQKLVQAQIKDGTYAPNAGFTLSGGWARNKYTGKMFFKERKKSTHPLTDSGKMRQNVMFIIREKEE